MEFIDKLIWLIVPVLGASLIDQLPLDEEVVGSIHS